MIAEAESASAGIRVLPDKSIPLDSVARLYARAGYLEDAARVLKDAKLPLGILSRAQTLYGDYHGALYSVSGTQDPMLKTSQITAIAMVLWSMGEPLKAGSVLNAAQSCAKTIRDPIRRERQFQMIQQQREVLPDPPPVPISAQPHLPELRRNASTAPAFPVTTDGFRQRDPQSVSGDALENNTYLTHLYDLLAKQDFAALKQHVATASSPFQKMLAIATLEHLLIQAGHLAEAEIAVQAIPDDRQDLSLAKAEAMTALGSAWSRQGNVEHAGTAFGQALASVQSVDSSLAMGKTVVTSAVAAAQAKCGLPGASNATFQLAFAAAGKVPQKPKPVRGVYSRAYFGDRYQDDAYQVVFETAIQAHDLAAARLTAKAWVLSRSDLAPTQIVIAWMEAGLADEAAAFARGQQNAAERFSCLLRLAGELLDQAGAPNI